MLLLALDSDVSVFITKVPAKAVLAISAKVTADATDVLNLKFISFSQTFFVSGNDYHDYISTLYKLDLMSFKNYQHFEVVERSKSLIF